MRIADFYPDIESFSEQLAVALNNAHTVWETQFVKDLSNRFSSYGKDVYLTESSVRKLQELQISFKDRKSKEKL